LIRVAVLGACGKMGSEVIKTVLANSDCVLVGACDIVNIGTEIAKDVVITNDFEEMVKTAKPNVVVDFAKPFSIEKNEFLMKHGVSPIIGTTGQTQEELDLLSNLSKEYGVCSMVIPNFALGAVLMMKFAGEIAKYMPDVEIIELHHDKKLDSPSGTALKTAKIIADARKEANVTVTTALGNPDDPARGFHGIDDIHIHSVRLSGYVAHQEVIFGGLGQTLTLRHDSIDRTSFMPGVLMCIRESQKRKDFVYGLDKLL